MFAKILKTINKKKAIDPSNNDPIYAGFHARSMAILIDCLIAAILFYPLFALMSYLIYGSVTPSEILDSIQIGMAQNTPTTTDNIRDAFLSSVRYVTSDPQFYDYFVVHHGFIKVVINQLLQLIILLSVFLFFWIKQQATPGKRMLSLKIVDATTLGKPTNTQLLIRMIGYIISALPALLGFLWIGFDPKKQGWHDKMANTLVIKDLSKKSSKGKV